MGPSPANKSNASAAVKDAAPSRPSFFSRLSLPILSRQARNIADFHIRPAEPHRQYAAGDHVAGAVVLTVVKPIRITHLTVSLHGFVRVFKSPNGVNEPPINPAEIPTSTSRAKFRYLGNGYASLFQDEQVLSADGKLEPRKYEFNFDLMFPTTSLPTSVDFERGTISYMITATLTRPTTISPTQTCERRIFLTEKLDVGLLDPPRPRTISLQPISKKSRRRKTLPPENASPLPNRTDSALSDPDAARANENSTEGSVTAEEVQQDGRHISFPRSPIHSEIMSEISGESVVSGASTGQSGRAHDASHTSSSGSQGASNRTRTPEKRVIVATIESLKGGCLPGDILPIKISVQHIKRIKSLHGVVVTLYRQGRIDSAPPIPDTGKLTSEDVRRLDKEYYYPRSKTGLGGLSLSSAGSCSVFRKDLVQTFQPLIIDPGTLGANVTAYVRVPEDCFPTIKGLPGEMISFKYQVEVLVDLGGKLAGQIQSVQSKVTPVGTPGVVGATTRSSYEQGGAVLTGSNVIDTDQLRRHKGVISVTFEVVVGTANSNKHRNRAISRVSTYTRQIDEAAQYPENTQGEWHGEGEPERYHEETPYHYGDGYFPPTIEVHDQHPPYLPPEPSRAPVPIYIPPPEVSEDNGLSEKERIRRAEQRLLPSQPPEALVASSSRAAAPAQDENIYDAEDEPTAPDGDAATPHATIEIPAVEDGPSAPTFEDLDPTPTAQPSEDKQELERRRLMQEASAPPECPEDYDAGVGSSSAPAAPAPATAPEAVDEEPSAPMLGEEDHYGHDFAYDQLAAGPSTAPAVNGVGGGPHEPLPKYER